MTALDLHGWDYPSVIDRAIALRSDDYLDQLWRDPQARVIEIDRNDKIRYPICGMRTSGSRQGTIFLGLCEGDPYFARRVYSIDGITYRDPRLSARDYQLISTALAIWKWQESTRYCPQCAHGLVFSSHGYSATCSGCGQEVFPRIDPAVIVAVLDSDDRLYLAHNRQWVKGRISVLAGYIEAGESAEQAIYREILEESSLTISAMKYLGSQPWPFPRSFMLAYAALASGEDRVDGDELQWGKWYRRDELRAEIEKKTITVPPPGSIAHAMVDGWLQSTITSSLFAL